MKTINENEIKDENICCFCGSTLNAWDGKPERFGNNPTPADTRPGKRCCDVCNKNIVIPARIYIADLIKQVTA